MINRKLAIVGLISTFALVGCGGDDDPIANAPDPGPAAPALDSAVRITHASPDAPAVNIYVDGSVLLSNVPFGASSGDIALPAGSIEVEVRAVLADGSELPGVIGPATLTTNSGERLDVVAYDTTFDDMSALNIKPQFHTTPLAADGDAQVSVFHAAPNVGDVDIYIGAPDGELADALQLDADFGDDVLGPVPVAAGSYRVRITGDGSDIVVFDTTLEVTAGDDLLVSAVTNTTGIGAVPVNLLVSTNQGAAIAFDDSVGAEVRVVHNSADTPEVDILVNGAEVLDAVPFPVASQYQDIAAPADTYNIVVAADIDNSIAPINVDVPLEQGKSYTAIAIGGLNAITDNTLELVLTEDNRRTEATGSYLRVVHGSYFVAENIPVDVYLTETADISGAMPAIMNLEYGAATPQELFPAGDYYVTVTAAGDATTVAFAAGPIPIEAGNNYTVIARDPGDGEVGAPLILATVLWDNEEESND